MFSTKIDHIVISNLTFALRRLTDLPILMASVKFYNRHSAPMLAALLSNKYSSAACA